MLPCTIIRPIPSRLRLLLAWYCACAWQVKPSVRRHRDADDDDDDDDDDADDDDDDDDDDDVDDDDVDDYGGDEARYTDRSRFRFLRCVRELSINYILYLLLPQQHSPIASSPILATRGMQLPVALLPAQPPARNVVKAVGEQRSVVFFAGAIGIIITATTIFVIAVANTGRHPSHSGPLLRGWG